jgi:hypothetical protein
LIRSVEPSYLLHATRCELLRYLQRLFRSKSPRTLGALNVAILLLVCLQVGFQIHIQCKGFITDWAVVILHAWKEDVWLKDILSWYAASVFLWKTAGFVLNAGTSLTTQCVNI